MPDFSGLDAILADTAGSSSPAVQLTIRWKGETVFECARGWLDPEMQQQPAQLDTLFDMASVSKLLVTTAFMTLVEEGQVLLDQPISSIFPEYTGLRPIQPYEDPLQVGSVVAVAEASGSVDAGKVTFRHLLTHTSGLPAWRPLWQQPDLRLRRRMALNTFFSCPVGSRVLYSDIGLILLGWAVEALTGQSLDQVVEQRVTRPLGLVHTCYLPVGRPLPVPLERIAPTEFCQWRQRRIRGEVHDENSWSLGGVTGHAGIFSTSGEMARFGQVFLDGGQPLLQPDTVREMTRLQAETNATRRGLGFVLWSPDPEASSNPFTQRAFGHTGFTGTSLWIDPETQLVVALLTNEVYNGRQDRKIMPLRVKIHRAIVDQLLC